MQSTNNLLPKALLADVAVGWIGSNQGQERSRADLGVAEAPSSLVSAMGKQSRPLMDVPWMVKQSHPGGGGSLLHHVQNLLHNAIMVRTGVYL